MPEDDLYRNLKTEGLPVIAVDRMLDPKHFACIVSHDETAAETLTASVLAKTSINVDTDVWELAS